MRVNLADKYLRRIPSKNMGARSGHQLQVMALTPGDQISLFLRQFFREPTTLSGRWQRKNAGMRPIFSVATGQSPPDWQQSASPCENSHIETARWRGAESLVVWSSFPHCGVWLD
jgi:hypothetical protein